MPAASNEALAASSGHKAHVWQPFSKDADLNYFSVASDAKIYCVQWNQNNKVVVSGGQAGVVTLNYNKDGALMGTLPKDAPTQEDRLSAISSIAFSRGSKLLAAGCMDSSVRVWDLKQQACKYFLESHKAAVTYVTFSTDDQYLASACLTGEIHLHTVRQTSQAAVLRTPGNRAKRSLHFTPLEPLLASGAEDGSLYVWDMTTYTLLDSYIQTHSATVSRVCFSPGSPNILISAGLDRAIVLTDRRLDAAIASVPAAHPLTALDCKDDGNCITAGNTAGKVHLFDPRKLSTPMMELSCSGAEPVSCLHWQQSTATVSKSAKKAPAIAPSLTPALARGHTARSQELLSAASPATPMITHVRQTEGAMSPEKPEQKPSRAASIASEHSLSNSETASFRSLHHGVAPADHEPAAARHAGSRIPRGEEASTSQNGALRSAEWPDPRNPLFPPYDPQASSSRQGNALPSTQAGLVGSAVPAREPPIQQEPTSKLGYRQGSGAMERGASRERLAPTQAHSIADSGRQRSASSAGVDSDVPARQDEMRGEGGGPSAFGSRLKRLMGVEDTGGPEPSGGGGSGSAGNGVHGKGAVEAPSRQAREAEVAWAPAAEELRLTITSDIKTLHFEMIRQFHIQQAEMRGMVDSLSQQQKQLVEEVAQLRAQVCQLSAALPPARLR